MTPIPNTITIYVCPFCAADLYSPRCGVWQKDQSCPHCGTPVFRTIRSACSHWADLIGFMTVKVYFAVALVALAAYAIASYFWNPGLDLGYSECCILFLFSTIGVFIVSRSLGWAFGYYLAVWRGFPRHLSEAISSRGVGRVDIVTTPEPLPPLPEGSLRGFWNIFYFVVYMFLPPAIVFGVGFGILAILKSERAEWPIFIVGACVGVVVSLFFVVTLAFTRQREPFDPRRNRTSPNSNSFSHDPNGTTDGAIGHGGRMEPRIYRMHSGAQYAAFLGGCGILPLVACCLLGLRHSAPVAGIILLIASSGLAIMQFRSIWRSSLKIDQYSVTSICFTTKQVAVSDITRIGLYYARAYGFVHRLMYRGNRGTVLYMKNRFGDTVTFHVYLFEHYEEFLQLLRDRTKLEYERIREGWLGARWPDQSNPISKPVTHDPNRNDNPAQHHGQIESKNGAINREVAHSRNGADLSEHSGVYHHLKCERRGSITIAVAPPESFELSNHPGDYTPHLTDAVPNREIRADLSKLATESPSAVILDLRQVRWPAGGAINWVSIFIIQMSKLGKPLAVCGFPILENLFSRTNGTPVRNFDAVDTALEYFRPFELQPVMPDKES